MILLIALDTYYNFRFFSVRDEEGKDRVCGRQLVCLFMLHFLANVLIWLNTGSVTMLAFYGAQVLFFLLYIYLTRLFYRNSSRLLVNNMCTLLATGFIILTRLNPDRAMRQFAIVAAAAVVTWIIPFIIDRVWQLVTFPWVYGILGLVLLAVVCVIGNTSYGAQLSLTFGGFTVQPSEFVKISFVFFVAAMFYQSTDRDTIIKTTVVAAVHVLVLVLSKDLGSALIFFVAYMTMLFVATSSYLWFGAGIAGGSVAAVAAYYLFPHVRRRVEAWADPWSDIANKGYQVAQALFAIGTGGWFGMGLYRGMPEKIPVVDKDFVFAAISEEICALCSVFVPWLLYAVHDDRDEDAGDVLQTDCIRAWKRLYHTGVPDDRRCDKVYPVDGCDAAACELRRKFHRLHIYHIPGHSGTLRLKTRRRRGGGTFK